MEEMEEKVQKQLEVRISKIQTQAEGISGSLKTIMNANLNITQYEAECQLEIDQVFESLINEIEEKKQQSSGYAKQKEELKAAQGEIQESIALATASLKDPVKFLSSQGSTCTKFDHVESKFQQLPLSVSRPQLLMVKVSDMQWQLAGEICHSATVTTDVSTVREQTGDSGRKVFRKRITNLIYTA